MSKRLYVAYGSNLNIKQMKYRCPTAKLYGTGVIEDYELQFKGYPTSAYATIAPKSGKSVPVAVWEIQPKDEASLDRYEGYPSHYFKQDVPVQLDGEEVNAMVYIMNLKQQFGMPSNVYYKTVHDGYLDCGLDTEVLREALKDSTVSFCSSAVGDYHQQGFFDETVEEYEDEYDEGYDETDVVDEHNPFYYF